MVCDCIPTQFLIFTHRFHNYSSEAVMGFCSLHQIVIPVIVYIVVNRTILAIAKWTFIASISFNVIMAIYKFLIRCVNVVRCWDEAADLN